MTLERMNDFFAARLAGYDEHMMSEIKGAREFYPYTASLLPLKIRFLRCADHEKLGRYLHFTCKAITSS